MQTIQIVLEEDLLREADRAARRFKMNRSALVRAALRTHLKQLQIKDLEERDRAGYASPGAGDEESLRWEKEAVWPVG